MGFLFRTRWNPAGCASWLALASMMIAGGLDAHGRPFRPDQIPNGFRFGCANCHNNPAGGGPRNAFGMAVEAIVMGPSNIEFWSAELAGVDSDGDGATNGEELGDPDGDGAPIPGHVVTNPGNPNSRPEPVNQAPVVGLTDPPTGSVFVAPALVVLRADAIDSDGTVTRVEFLDGSVSLGAATEAPFTLTATLEPGEHTLVARATDDDGATGDSPPVTVIVVSVAPPSLSITAGDVIDVTWTEGAGPFAAQSRRRVDDFWQAASMDVLFTNRATLARSAGGGFVRVADLGTGGPWAMTAVLGGSFERPNPVESDGAGRGSFQLTGNRLRFHVEYSGLSGTATRAHIHGPAGMDAAASVMVDLEPFNGGEWGEEGAIAGEVTLTPAQVEAVLSGRAYVNIHTEANASGEIRGQILPVVYQAILRGTNERPDPVESEGGGIAVCFLEGDMLTMEVAYRGLSGPAIMAHIHGPAGVEEAAGVLVDLEPFNGGGFGVSGRLSGTAPLSAETLEALATGRTYINLHTEQHSSGEIRGQLVPAVTAIPFMAELTGDAERPDPVETGATGRALLALEGNALVFSGHYQGLSGAAIGAHIHGPADREAAATVMIDLEPFNGSGFGVNGTLSGWKALTTEQKAALLDGLTYMNVHTPDHGAGEIRGQIEPAGAVPVMNP